MALVTIQNINVLDNPSYFTSPFQFEIIFDCLQELEDGKLLFFVVPNN